MDGLQGFSGCDITASQYIINIVGRASEPPERIRCTHRVSQWGQHRGFVAPLRMSSVYNRSFVKGLDFPAKECLLRVVTRGKLMSAPDSEDVVLVSGKLGTLAEEPERSRPPDLNSATATL